MKKYNYFYTMECYGNDEEARYEGKSYKDAMKALGKIEIDKHTHAAYVMGIINPNLDNLEGRGELEEEISKMDMNSENKRSIILVKGNW